MGHQGPGAKATGEKVPISRRALFQRIDRVLAKQGWALRFNRRGPGGKLGSYYIVDVKKGFVVEHDVAPEELGRRLDVIAAFETVEKGKR
jgi:hypothetical protein